MARNLQPKHHMCRRIGEKLCDLDKCPTARRTYGPGIHGPKIHRKLTEYGTQLLEKQKARAVYGILERQLRKYYDEAIRRPGDTGQILTELLETRLDNIVFRLGFAKSRAAARQMVGHGHITVNGKRVTIPSYHVRAENVIAVEDRRRTSPLFKDLPRTIASREIPAWLGVEAEKFQGRVIRLPGAGDIHQPFRTQSIVEFYSR
ncbi:30S ribosomal protein S4 [Candidatus Uhrbacteria bacterium]|nr:30S ribosomal protein S4 [Candidatus Uhrbacteria bacterium]